MRRVILVPLAAVAVIAGCGGSSSGNGVAAKTPNEIIAAAKAASDTSHSAHVAGTIRNGAETIDLDLNMLAGSGARGHMAVNGIGVDLIRDGATVYLNGGPTFWRQFGGSSVVALLSGRWLKAPSTGSNFAAFVSLTDLHRLLDTALANHGTLTRGGTTTVNGQKVIVVSDTSKGGTVDIATTGRPYPIQLAKTGTNGGAIAFDRWDKPVTLTAPPNAIDVPRLSGQ